MGFCLADRKDITSIFGQVDPLAFDADYAKSRFKALFFQAEETKSVPVISHESLSGMPYLNGGMNAKDFADQIKQTFPDAKILIILREQRSLLFSYYNMDIADNGGFQKARDFLKPTRKNYGRRSQFLPDGFKYDRLIKYYFNLFGNERVKVIPYELLKNSREDFIRAISDFCEVDWQDNMLIDDERVNVSRSSLTISIQRHVNRIVNSRPENSIGVPPAISLWVSRGLFKILDERLLRHISQGVNARSRHHVDELFDGYFCDSNKETVKLTGLDLASFGYQI